MPVCWLLIKIFRIKEVEARKEIVEICSEFHEYNLKEFMKLYEKKPTTTRLDCLKTDKQRNPADYKMPLDMIKSISFQLLKGLSYLHHRGIIHRNLKCDNVLITKESEVKISDFALSRLVSIPHVPYTPEIVFFTHGRVPYINFHRILRIEKDQEEKPEDFGTVHLSSYCGNRSTLSRLTSGLSAAFLLN